MKELRLVVIIIALGIMTSFIGIKLDTLTQVIREKQIILSIDKFEWTVEAQKGSAIHLPLDGGEIRLPGGSQ